MLKWIRLLPFIWLAATACSRSGSSSLTSLSFQTPTLSHLRASIPANRKPCFAVSVRGDGITPNTAACSPVTGIVSGFAESGQTISLAVPRGENRTVDLFMFLEPNAANDACPNFSGALDTSQLGSTYLVASQSSVSTAADQTDVTLNVVFPGITQNIATQLSMASACTTAAIINQGATAYRLSPDAQVVTAGGMKMTVRFGHSTTNQAVTAGVYKLTVH